MFKKRNLLVALFMAVLVVMGCNNPADNKPEPISLEVGWWAYESDATGLVQTTYLLINDRGQVKRVGNKDKEYIGEDSKTLKESLDFETCAKNANDSNTITFRKCEKPAWVDVSPYDNYIDIAKTDVYEVKKKVKQTLRLQLWSANEDVYWCYENSVYSIDGNNTLILSQNYISGNIEVFLYDIEKNMFRCHFDILADEETQDDSSDNANGGSDTTDEIANATDNIVGEWLYLYPGLSYSKYRYINTFYSDGTGKTYIYSSGHEMTTTFNWTVTGCTGTKATLRLFNLSSSDYSATETENIYELSFYDNFTGCIFSRELLGFVSNMDFKKQ